MPFPGTSQLPFIAFAAGVVLLGLGNSGWSAEPLGAPPSVVEQAKTDEPETMVWLGKELFFDLRLSADESIACSSCHQPRLAFSDNRSVPLGVGGRKGRRKSPSLLNVSSLNSFGWDGAAATLDAQISKALVNPDEMSLSPEDLDGFLSKYYAQHIPKSAGRGGRATLVAAIAAYVRTLKTGDSRFDRFLFGSEPDALSAEEIRGFEIFRSKGRCISCHTVQHESTHPFGGHHASFTDGRFHAVGVEKVRWIGALRDTGRLTITGDLADYGFFKTPSLRNVALTPPYMHDGSIPTLEGVVDFYDRGGNNHYNQDALLRPLGLSSREKMDLVAFLRSLTDSCFEGAGEGRCGIFFERSTTERTSLN